jgi:hypothetical protein
MLKPRPSRGEMDQLAGNRVNERLIFQAFRPVCGLEKGRIGQNLESKSFELLHGIPIWEMGAQIVTML